jgi:hypothetical protein
MPEPSSARRPWPLKWIVVAILAVVVPYTWLTLYYRKPGPAFQPYEDLRRQANVKRLLAAGYQRITLAAQRPADQPAVPGGADARSAPGGLPADLVETLVEPQPLAEEILTVRAAPAVARLLPYTIELTCRLASDQEQLAGGDLYVRGNQLVLAPRFERVSGALQTRSRQTIALLTLPGGTLAPGAYEVLLPGVRGSRAWRLEVR